MELDDTVYKQQYIIDALQNIVTNIGQSKDIFSFRKTNCTLQSTRQKMEDKGQYHHTWTETRKTISMTRVSQNVYRGCVQNR